MSHSKFCKYCPADPCFVFRITEKSQAILVFIPLPVIYFLCLNASKIFSFSLKLKCFQTLARFILFSLILYPERGNVFHSQTWLLFQLKNVSFYYVSYYFWSIWPGSFQTSFINHILSLSAFHVIFSVTLFIFLPLLCILRHSQICPSCY